LVYWGLLCILSHFPEGTKSFLSHSHFLQSHSPNSLLSSSSGIKVLSHLSRF
jgi:hypothetical protein